MATDRKILVAKSIRPIDKNDFFSDDNIEIVELIKWAPNYPIERIYSKRALRDISIGEIIDYDMVR